MSRYQDLETEKEMQEMQVSIILAFIGFRRSQSKSLVIYVAVGSAAILRATRCKTTVSS